MLDKKFLTVQNIMQQYIDGVYQGNVEKLKGFFHKKAVMNGFLGEQMLIGGPEPFFEDIGKNPSMSKMDIPYNGEITSIEITGLTANVTIKETGFAGTYNFINYFHLMKVDGEWKIMSKIFTSV